MAEYRVMEATCPRCGSADVDLSYSDKPLEDGVKCFDCGLVYELTGDNGREVARGEVEI